MYLPRPTLSTKPSSIIHASWFEKEFKNKEEELRESEEKYRILVENANEAIIVAQEGMLKFVNSKSIEMTGYSKEELYSLPFTHFIHEEDREMVVDRYLRRLQGEKLVDIYSFKIVTQKGGIKWVEINAILINWEGRPATLNFLNDITQRKEAEELLQQSEEQYRDLFENVTDMILSFSVDGKFRYVNNAWLTTLGYTLEDIRHVSVWDIIHPDHLTHCKEVFASAFSEASVRNLETIFKTKAGHPLMVEGNISCFLKERQPVYMRGIFRDISKHKELEEELRSLSLRDDLTNLYNRRGFIALAEQQIKIANRIGRKMMLLFVDLDGMKQINDTLGHLEGDRALMDAGSILKFTIRESDLIARMGGDEFVSFIMVNREDISEIITARLKENIDALNTRRERPYKLLLSVGIAYYDSKKPRSIEELLSEADKDMYQKKKEKREEGP